MVPAARGHPAWSGSRSQQRVPPAEGVCRERACFPCVRRGLRPHDKTPDTDLGVESLSCRGRWPSPMASASPRYSLELFPPKGLEQMRFVLAGIAGALVSLRKPLRWVLRLPARVAWPRVVGGDEQRARALRVAWRFLGSAGSTALRKPSAVVVWQLKGDDFSVRPCYLGPSFRCKWQHPLSGAGGGRATVTLLNSVLKLQINFSALMKLLLRKSLFSLKVLLQKALQPCSKQERGRLVPWKGRCLCGEPGGRGATGRSSPSLLGGLRVPGIAVLRGSARPERGEKEVPI